MIGVAERGLAAPLSAVVDGLLEADLRVLPPLELAELLAEVETQRRRLDAFDTQLIAALAAAASPAEFGATSVPDLVAGLTRTTRGEARARVQRSVDLAERWTLTGEALAPIHPQTAAALTAGEVSGAHVDVITRYLGKIPADVALQVIDGPDGPRSVFEAGESFLVNAARHEDPASLRRSGELLLARLDPDGQEPRDDDAERQRSFGIGGRHPNDLYGRVTDEAKAVLQAMLDPLAAPCPGPDGEPDPRSIGQRQHDALLEAALRLLRSGTLPDSGGTPAAVIIRVDADDLSTTAKGQPGGVALTGHGDVVSISRFLHLADQAEVTTVVLTAHGGILDYGRTRRLASPGQRRALTARDGGCCFPGCARPAAWCEAHHVVAWLHGGPTAVDNLCLLCTYHHATFEDAGWAVTITDGVPHWSPPAWLDPERKPRRNTTHHLPEITFATMGAELGHNLGRPRAVTSPGPRVGRCRHRR